MVFWGGNNAAVKHLVANDWPPVWIGCSRMGLCAVLLFALMRWTPWFGKLRPIDPGLNSALWWRGGLSLAVYVVVFTCAIQYNSVARVAIFLGASPVWMLLMEGKGAWGWHATRRYLAAIVAFSGVTILFWPQIKGGQANWLGDGLGLLSGILWAGYCRLCGVFQGRLTGPEITAQTMWRASALLSPIAVWELFQKPLALKPTLIGLQIYCAIFGGVLAFGIWHSALLRWPPGRVFLFNNIIPLTTMFFAWRFLDETVSGNFLVAMALVIAGVALGQKITPKSSPS